MKLKLKSEVCTCFIVISLFMRENKFCLKLKLNMFNRTSFMEFKDYSGMFFLDKQLLNRKFIFNFSTLIQN